MKIRPLAVIGAVLGLQAPLTAGVAEATAVQVTPTGGLGGRINVTTATTTRVAAGAAGAMIYITKLDLVVSGADTVTLEYGNGNCASVVGVLDGPLTLAANAVIVEDGAGSAIYPPVPAGDDVCIVTTGNVTAGGSWLGQQF